jgi:thiamine-monophosphate kinase
MGLGEFDIIAKYFAGHDRRTDVLLGVGDDAAVLDVGDARKLVVAIDTIVDGVRSASATAHWRSISAILPPWERCRRG